MGVEDGLQAPAFRSTGDSPQPGIEIPGPASEDHANDREREDDGDETDGERTEIGPNERVEVDPMVLRWVARV